MRKKRLRVDLRVDLEAEATPVLMHQYADRAKWTATTALLRMRSEACGAWPTLAGEPSSQVVPISPRRLPKRQHIGLGGSEVDFRHYFTGASAAPLSRIGLIVPPRQKEEKELVPFAFLMQQTQHASIEIERGSSEEDESDDDTVCNSNTFAQEISAAVVRATGLIARLERLHIAVLGGGPGPM